MRGRAGAPPSKSYTIRGLMCAALADGESEIAHPLVSDDTRAAVNVLRQVGARIRADGEGWHVSGGRFHEPDGELFCGESAATLRFMTAIASLIPGECRLTAAPSLARRPVEPLLGALRQLGVDCSAPGGAPPVVVEGGGLRGGGVALPGDVSSQFVSALLLVAPLAGEKVNISLTTPLESKPFLLMTIDCLEKFGIGVEASPDLRELAVARQGYQPARYNVEGDWSSASYLLALGAVAGEVTVENIDPLSRQGDRVIVDFLKDMGAPVRVGRGSVTVSRSGLRAIEADLSDCIDLLPTVAVLAAVAEGTSRFTGVERARLKESDRVSAVKAGLAGMGIAVADTGNALTITGAKPRGAVIDSRADHRIAMAFAIPGLLTGETIIDNGECVAKTFPRFWDVLKGLGAEVKIDG